MWGWLLATHAIGATYALVVGAVVVLRPRKGDLAHRILGAVWAADMYWVCLSSFWIKRLEPHHFSPIHLLSVWTLISLTVGLGSGIRGNIQRHRGFMVGSYLGLCGAGIAAAAVPVRIIPRTLVHRPFDILWAVSAATFAAGLSWWLVWLASANRSKERGSPSRERPAPVAGNASGPAAELRAWSSSRTG